MSLFDHLFRLGYSRDLHKQLKGMSLDCNGYTGNAAYQISSIVIITVSLLIMLNYYYGLFNNPRFTHRRVWLLNMLFACCLTGIFAYISAVSYLPAEKHCPDIRFTWMDCLLFAITQMIYTLIVCLLCSLLFKWKSISNKKIPF